MGAGGGMEQDPTVFNIMNLSSNLKAQVLSLTNFKKDINQDPGTDKRN